MQLIYSTAPADWAPLHLLYIDCLLLASEGVGFEDFECQGLRARLCCHRYLTPYFGYIILPHADWPAQCLAQRKSQKKYTKRKDRNR